MLTLTCGATDVLVFGTGCLVVIGCVGTLLYCIVRLTLKDLQ